jgi:hypothetical protein
MPRKDRPNQIIFGLALIGSLLGRETFKNRAKIIGQGVDFGVGQTLPINNARDRFLKEVGRKQAPLRYVFGCHALGVPCQFLKQRQLLRLIPNGICQPDRKPGDFMLSAACQALVLQNHASRMRPRDDWRQARTSYTFKAL